jgi:rSAM/selenodomain-associated transferase 1
MNRLYFAAKAPIPGQVKTRLGATIGMQAAANLYAAFLSDLVQRFADAPFDVAWYVTAGSWRSLESLVVRADAVRIQRGTGWAARQANLFRDCDAAGEVTVVLAATDSPQLEKSRVEEAFAALAAHDVVLGPTCDGGYYLIGMNRFNDVFASASMGTTAALVAALERARAMHLSVHLLEPEFDVDTEQDLGLLEREVNRRRDLGCTASELALIRGSRTRVA